MAEGYDEDEKAEPLDEGMDEFLCEYVDGSMDPVVLQAFEEYLRANPDMARHAQCLCQARDLLASHSACPHSSSELQQKLREAIARDMLGEPGSTRIEPRLGSFAVLTSAMGLMVMLGMLFGNAMVDLREAHVPYEYVERESAPSDAHPYRAVRLSQPYQNQSRTAFGLPGPAMALPVLTSSARFTPLNWADSATVALASP